MSWSTPSGSGPFPVPVHDLGDLRATDPVGVDVVYERYSLGHLDGLDLARRIGARFVLEVNAPLVAEARAHRPDTVEAQHGDIEETLLHEADLVITVSSVLTRWAGRRRSGPTVTVPNGFEPSWFPTTPTTPTQPTLAFIGHPKPWHGTDRLLPLLDALARRGHRPHLLIIGGGPGADQLMADAHRLGVADQVTVTGPLPPEQASALLPEATIGVAPYPRHEPFYFCPLKVIDYLAAGLPIVSTDQGDIAQLTGDAGILVDPDRDRELVDAVATLLATPNLAARFGASGRRRAHATMTWAHAGARTAAAINTLDTTMVTA